MEPTDEEVKIAIASTLWDVLSDVPIDLDEQIEEDFLFFEAGTDREDIWLWFESYFGINIARSLMFLGGLH